MNATPRLILLSVLGLLTAPASFGQPYVATQLAAPGTTTNAMLNGMVTPRGLSTAAWFEWGATAGYGQTTTPVSVGSGSNVMRVSALVEGLTPDSSYYCRLVASNSVGVTYGWVGRFTTGRRVASWGEIVLGTSGAVLPPTNLAPVVGIAAGDYHGLALKTDGTIAIWGRYNNSYPVVPPPTDLSNVVAIAGGRSHSLAVNAAGNLVVWGDNTSGQTNVPANVSNVVAITAGDAHCLALKSDGTLATWGRLGQGNFTIATIPAGLSNVVAISSGDTFSVALKNNGTVAAWGDTTYSQTSVPVGLTNVVAIAAGYQHVLALKSDGTIVAWGSGAGRNLMPAGLSNMVAIASGDNHAFALKNDGTVTAWGTSVAGPITPPTGLNDIVSLTCGDEFSLALAANTPPQTLPRTLTGPVNQDTVLSLGILARDPNNDPLTWKVLTLPAAGVLYQYSSGERGSAYTETNTPVTDPAGRVIFAPAPDEFGAPYTSFPVAANDGEADSAPSLATIFIIPAPTATVTITNQSSNLGVAVSFPGLSNASYSIWVSTNLANWSRLATASQPTPGQFLYHELSIKNLPKRFYRIRAP